MSTVQPCAKNNLNLRIENWKKEKKKKKRKKEKKKRKEKKLSLSLLQWMQRYMSGFVTHMYIVSYHTYIWPETRHRPLHLQQPWQTWFTLLLGQCMICEWKCYGLFVFGIMQEPNKLYFFEFPNVHNYILKSQLYISFNKSVRAILFNRHLYNEVQHNLINTFITGVFL